MEVVAEYSRRGTISEGALHLGGWICLPLTGGNKAFKLAVGSGLIQKCT